MTPIERVREALNHAEESARNEYSRHIYKQALRKLEGISLLEDSILIQGFPWSDVDFEDGLRRSELCEQRGLLTMEETIPGSHDEDEYGQWVFRLTNKGREAQNYTGHFVRAMIAQYRG